MRNSPRSMCSWLTLVSVLNPALASAWSDAPQVQEKPKESPIEASQGRSSGDAPKGAKRRAPKQAAPKSAEGPSTPPKTSEPPAPTEELRMAQAEAPGAAGAAPQESSASPGPTVVYAGEGSTAGSAEGAAPGDSGADAQKGPSVESPKEANPEALPPAGTPKRDNTPACAPQGDPPRGFWERDTLTGDWGGLRSAMTEHGLDIGLTYTGDIAAAVSGGIKTGATYLGDGDIRFTADLERLSGLSGGSLFVYALWTHGGQPTADYLGDAQAADNIEAPAAFKLFEAWYQQFLFDRKASLLAGLYNVAGEFDATQTALLFLNSSMGMGKDFSQSGRMGPSIFPVTSAGLRVKVVPTETSYLQAAVLDGVPGDPEDPTRSNRPTWDVGT